MPTNPTISSITPFERFIQDRKYLKNVSPRTVSSYCEAWKAFQPFVEPAITNGTIREGLRQAIESLLARGLKPVSVNSYLTGIRAFVGWMAEEGIITLRPKITLLRFERKVLETFSPAQVKALLSFRPKGANQTRAHTVACLLLDTGLRISEALELRRSGCDLDNLVLRVLRKGNKQQLVPISFEMRKILWRWLAGRHTAQPAQTAGTLLPQDGLVFGTRNHTRVTNRNFQRDLKQIGAKLGLTGVRVSPHTLRHTFAVSYLRAGGNLFYLSRILGHTSVRTTERYLQSLQVEDLQAVHSRLSLLANG